jgi:hypothetical protein
MVGVNDRPEMSNKWETQGRNPGMMVRSARRSRILGLSSRYLHNNETSLNAQPPRSVFFHVKPVPSFPSHLASSRSSFTSSWLTVFLHFQPGPSLLHLQTAVTALPFRCLASRAEKILRFCPQKSFVLPRCCVVLKLEALYAVL